MPNKKLLHSTAFLLPLVVSTATFGQQATTAPTTNLGATPTSTIQHVDFNMTAAVRPADISPSGTLSKDKAEDVLKNVCTDDIHPSVPYDAQLNNGSTYALINIVRFSNNADGTRQAASNNWYLYSRNNHKRWYGGWPHGWTVSDFDGATRLYGARQLLLISVFLNLQAPEPPAVSYAFTITKTTATNVASLESLLGAVLPPSAAAPGGPPADTYVGCNTVPVAYANSSIKVDTVYPSGSATSPFKASATFVNESKQYWDVSFALPIKKASALQYNSTANTVTASTINKQSLFAVADFYLPPANLTASGYSLIPHPFAGVAMNSQPLHSLLFGGAVGLHLGEVYAGVLLLKQQQLAGLSTGGTATPGQLSSATSYAFKPSFSVGIKISISAGVKAFSKSK